MNIPLNFEDQVKLQASGVDLEDSQPIALSPVNVSAFVRDLICLKVSGKQVPIKFINKRFVNPTGGMLLPAVREYLHKNSDVVKYVLEQENGTRVQKVLRRFMRKDQLLSKKEYLIKAIQGQDHITEQIKDRFLHIKDDTRSEEMIVFAKTKADMLSYKDQNCELFQFLEHRSNQTKTHHVRALGTYQTRRLGRLSGIPLLTFCVVNNMLKGLDVMTMCVMKKHDLAKSPRMFIPSMETMRQVFLINSRMMSIAATRYLNTLITVMYVMLRDHVIMKQIVNRCRAQSKNKSRPASRKRLILAFLQHPTTLENYFGGSWVTFTAYYLAKIGCAPKFQFVQNPDNYRHTITSWDVPVWITKDYALGGQFMGWSSDSDDVLNQKVAPMIKESYSKISGYDHPMVAIPKDETSRLKTSFDEDYEIEVDPTSELDLETVESIEKGFLEQEIDIPENPEKPMSFKPHVVEEEEKVIEKSVRDQMIKPKRRKRRKMNMTRKKYKPLPRRTDHMKKMIKVKTDDKFSLGGKKITGNKRVVRRTPKSDKTKA